MILAFGSWLLVALKQEVESMKCLERRGPASVTAADGFFYS